MDRVKNKVALVSGAAMGIGQAQAELLAAEGAHVFVCDREEKLGAQVADGIRAKGGKADFLRLDVTREKDWSDAVEAVRARAARLDVLVNNAGILLLKPLHETAPDEWDRVFDVNVRGVYLGIRAVVPLMKETGGSIINLSSIYGLVGAPSAGAYISSKGAVRLMTKSCAVDLMPMKIRVNSIHPGVVDSPMTKDLLHTDPETRKAILASTLFDRPCRPDEIAQGVLFLASDESSFMQGSELVIDGGYTAN
ncbi:MAG: glucose 1-dehydrogenase [Burkholderiaceae bacterium]